MIHSMQYTCFALLTSFGLATLPAQAQSTLALHQPSQPADVSTTKTRPAKPKASESAFYLKVYGLYGLLTPNPQLNHRDVYNNNVATNYQSYTTKLGLGPRAGIGLGVIVSDFINLGLDADMLFNTTPAATITTTPTLGVVTAINSSLTSTLKLLSVSPNITFKALSRPSYYIYNRLGFVGGVVLAYQAEEHYEYTFLKSPYSADVQTNYTKNSLAIGYQAAIGIQFRLSQKLRGFAEVVLYNQTFKPQEYQTTTLDPGNPVNPKSVVTTVVNTSGAYLPSTNQPAGTPHNQPSFNVNINSLNAGIGLVFRP